MKIVSTFSGCGGSSLGYQLAGGKVLLAVEWDANAVETYRLNFPETDIYHGDIAALSVDEVLQRTNLQPGELGIFDGSPPCQGFSTANKKGAASFSDPRNQLFREYVRLLDGLQPKCFVMENVSGMVKGRKRLIFAEILRSLKACGYRVKARLLNAQFYNVPQSRQRLIFVGVRNDLNIEPSHPPAQTRPISVREALEGCPVEYVKPERNGKISTIMQKFVGDGESVSDYCGPSYGFNYARASWNRPAPTICKTMAIYHPEEPRMLTGREAARLASFPDSFQFVGNWQQITSRIGNSVPPNLMRAIAEHIKQAVIAS
jgi:DNA (cytosine-5)-methyltransferase 1